MKRPVLTPRLANAGLGAVTRQGRTQAANSADSPAPVLNTSDRGIITEHQVRREPVMILDRIRSLLETCSRDDAVIPPTDLYNEGWMLRLVLDWLHQHRDRAADTSIPFPQDARWYSEALLPSAFLPRERGDKLAESWTHADGVIGQFQIGGGAKGDFSLLPHAQCFVVVEAKMFSKLSSGVKNASFYNQAARNVACMAEVVSLANLRPDQIDTLGFYVVAPSSQIEEGVFSPYMTHDHIKETVKRRVDGYEGKRDDWYHGSFLPALDRIDIGTIAWKEIVSEIYRVDAEFGAALAEFYANCLRFNRAAAPPRPSR